MVSVTVRFYATLKEKTGQFEVKVSSPKTLRELLLKLGEIYGKELLEALYDTEKDVLRRGVIIFINGLEPYYKEGLDTELNDGDVVAIFPPAGGG